MGPSGCGKSTVAQALSQATGWTCIEGDDHHPPANIRKMQSGIALTDADRAGWIDSLLRHANALADKTIVIACSALTPYVQTRLTGDSVRTCRFILLNVPEDVLASRLQSREGHFMSADLLSSQLAALTPPEAAISVDATLPMSEIVRTIRAVLENQ